MKKKYIIIVAGGSGKRMNSNIPKQFLPLNGMPILMHTILQFYRYDKAIEIIIVLPETQFAHWTTICKSHNFTIPHTTIHGGKERFYSVKNGLSLIKDKASIIGIHDGVRPLVSVETITKLYHAAEQYGAAIPVLPMQNSIRKILHNGKNEAVNRTEYRTVHTPQCFKAKWLLDAYNNDFNIKKFTDDATVVESLGKPITLIESNRENIKITTPMDLSLAELLLKNTYL